MRIGKLISVGLVCLVLSACASVLIGNKAQALMMKSLFKPLVGFDPTEVKILENSMVKSRMQALLGNKYDATMKLLNTAQEIQQEGALFYIASHYAPTQVQSITDKAGLIWNSNTNQMAVLLIKDGTPEIFSEQIEGVKEKLTPTLPQELQRSYDKAKAIQDSAKNLRDGLLDNPANSIEQKMGVESLRDSTEAELIKSVDQTPADKLRPATDATTEKQN